MPKVRCNVCSNELGDMCTVKKTRINKNKSRNCEAYIFDGAKIKAKQDIPTNRVGYSDRQEAKRRMKAELKEIREEMKRGPAQGTAQNLGLIQPGSQIIKPGDPKFSMPRTDSKHPLTGDLSRFTTTAKSEE